MGLSVVWYSEKARDEAVAVARKMNEALEKRVAELERIIGAPAEAVRELHAEPHPDRQTRDETMTISREYAEELGRQIDELEAENERLRGVLKRISDWCPATQEMTLAHQMAQEAEDALVTTDDWQGAVK